MSVKFLEPEEIEIETAKGDKKTFILSKFPATVGREVILKYPTANAPKIGDYETSEDTMLKVIDRKSVV